MKSGNLSGLVFIFLTVMFTVTGQLLLKKGMGLVGVAPQELRALPNYLWNALTQPMVLGSFASAALAAFSWMAAMSRCELSFAYPFMGLSIVLTLAMTPLMFGERLHLHQWVGVALVCAGVWVASRPTS